MRQILLSSVLLLGSPLLAQTVDVNLTAAPGTVNLGPGYPAEPAWLYGGTLPGQVIRATQGQTLRVHFRNLLPEPTTVHFHGQPSTLGMDGMEGLSRPATAPGEEFRYEIRNLQSGTYWFHPHDANHHMQLDMGLYGVLIVDPPSPSLDPAYDVEQVIVLDDWNASSTGGTYTGPLLNGKTSLGQQTITVSPGQKLRLRILNAAATTHFVVALDGHPLTVTHTDGNRIQPLTVQSIPIGIGERYDAIVDCTNPGVWSLAVSTLQNRAATVVRGIVRYTGQTGPDPSPAYVPPNLSTGSLLSYAQLASYWPATTPITTTPNRTYPVQLGMQMGGGGIVYTINGQAWPNVTAMPVAFGDVVQFDLATAMGAGMLHPMHLHGHSVQLMGTAGGTLYPPIKDTVLVRGAGQPGGTISVQWRADNPGRWLYHCHDLVHMANGMMTLVDYQGDRDGDGLADVVDMEPLRDWPVLTVPDHEMAFHPGGAGNLSLQWQPGQWFLVYVALQELAAPLVLPPYGEQMLPPGGCSLLASGTVPAAGVAAVPYALPADPALSGFRLVLQALAGSTLPGGMRLSTDQAFRVL